MFKRALPFSITKRGVFALVGTLLMLMGTTAPLVNAAATTQNTAKVSFTFDDGLASALNNAAPVLAAHGLTGTDYVITSCIGMTVLAGNNSCRADNTKDYMTSSQIQQLHSQYGWEIGSHTVTHPQLAVADGAKDGSLPGGAAQVTSELTQSKQTIAGILGAAPSDLAFPYGDYDNNALSEAAKYYETARGFADLGYNTYPYNQSLLVNEQIQEGKTVGTIKGVTYAQAKAYVDAAIAGNQWLVLTFHNISTTTPTSADDYSTSTALLDQIAAYVQQQQAAGKISSVNVTDGITRGTDLMANGDFASGIANGWTTDSATITADSGNNGRYPEPTHSVSLKTAAGATTEGHLYSPQVAVTYGQQYILKNYVHMLSGGSVNFYIDEYDAAGNKLTGVDPKAGMAYTAVANGVNVSDINFTYTPSSATVAKAALQVIVKGSGTQAYYDGAQWLNPDGSTVVVPPTTKAGDANGDGVVNIKDATLVSLNWGKTGMTRAQGDLNADGVVNIKDATLVSLNWGK